MSSAPIKILYIEDSLDDKMILEEYLMDAIQHCSIDHSTTLKGSYPLLRKNSYDLVLLDLSLPDVRGVEAVIRLNGKLQSAIPIIVLTGLSDHSMAIEALKQGAQDFLVKGDYNTIVLDKAIRYAIERQKVQLELISKNREILISRDRLSKAEEMADLGSWEINLKTRSVKLSYGMKLLLQLESDIDCLDIEEFAAFVYENDKFSCFRALINTRDFYTPTTIEAKLARSDGQLFDALCKAEISATPDNDHMVIYGITFDVSHLKEAERVKEEFTNQLAQKVKERTTELEKTKRKLEKSLRKEKELGELKSRFVSTASHQFRTPLTVIQSNIGLLEMQLEKLDTPILKTPMFDKVTSRIKREVIRMTSIMDEVLILSKINSGGIVPVKGMSNILDICTSVLSKYNEIQNDDRTALIKVIGTNQPILIDRNLFEQAFSNMVSNAFKYSKNHPAPEITLYFKENELNIEVRDFGMGIPQQDLDNLFTPFFRASNVLDIPGTGLGTTIMQEYITLNGGKLTVKSKEKEGTTFNIHFKIDNNEKDTDS